MWRANVPILCRIMKNWRCSMPPADQTERSRRTMVMAMLVSAGATVVIAIVLGALVAPYLYAIALLAIIDVWLARAYSTGRLRLASNPRLGRAAEGGVVPGPSGDAAGDAPPSNNGASADPAHNPYARED